MDPLQDRYADLEPVPTHDMDIVSVFCEWRNCWVAYDSNDEPDDVGRWNGPFGEGRTRKEAEAALIEAWEDQQ